MTNLALFTWAEANGEKYPALSKLAEEKIYETHILKLPVQYGRHNGLIVTFEKTLAYALRRRRRNYAVAFAESYEMAQKWLLECADWASKQSGK